MVAISKIIYRVSVGIVRLHEGIMRQHKFVQTSNNTIMLSLNFPVYVFANEEVENYYECSKCDARTWNMNLIFLHLNNSFVLLGKVYLKIRIHMNIYFIAAS